MNSAVIKKFIPVIIVVIILIVGIIGKSIFDRFLIFNIISSTKDVSAITTIIQYDFNRDLSSIDTQAAEKKITFNQRINKVVKIKGKKLTIYLQSAPEVNQEFTVFLSDIQSTGNDSITKDFSYSVQYADTKKLSSEEVNLDQERSDSFSNDYPLSQKLPLIASQYQITSQFPNAGSYKMPITIDCLTREPLPSNLQGDAVTDPNDPDVQAFTTEVRQCRDNALTQLRENGFNTDKYTLVCSEPVLLKEYGCTLDESN